MYNLRIVMLETQHKYFFILKVLRSKLGTS